MKSISLFVKNGLYIPFLSLIIYYYTNNFFLSMVFYLKLFPTNFYYFYADEYNYLPKGYNFLIQFVRFTDTGHLASLLYLIDKNYLPLSFNIHFLITFAYWSGRFFFNMKESQEINKGIIMKMTCELHCILNHGLPLLMFTNILVNFKPDDNPFTILNIYSTFNWILNWIMYIYFPWRFLTGDTVYTVLDVRYTSFKGIFLFVSSFFILILISNSLGFLIYEFI